MDASTPQPSESASPLTRSTFVTVVAWVFIVISGFVVFISILQIAMAIMFFSSDKSRQASRLPAEFQQMPSVIRFFFENPLILAILFWSVAVITFIAAIGLLRRKNWARIIFIGVIVCAIAWNLGALWLQLAMPSSFPVPASAPSDFASDFATFEFIMKIATTAFAIILSVTFGWIAVRLNSRSVKAEFHAL